MINRLKQLLALVLLPTPGLSTAAAERAVLGTRYELEDGHVQPIP